MPGIFTRNLNVAPSVSSSTLVGVSEETTDELYKTTVENIVNVNKIGCKVFLGSNFEMLPRGDLVIPFNTVDFDFGSGWDNVNYKYIVPENGIYIIYCYCYISSGSLTWGSSDEMYISLKYFSTANSLLSAYFVSPSGTNPAIYPLANKALSVPVQSHVLNATAGDEIQVEVYNAPTGSAVPVINGMPTGILSYFSAIKLY